MARTPQADGSRLARLEDALKLRYLGIGFIWAWIYGSFETFALFPDKQGIGINADASWLASASTVVIVLFAGAVLTGRRPLVNPRRVGLAAAGLASAGTVLATLSTPSAIPAVVAVASGACTGTGTGLLVILWGDALSRLEEDQAELAIPAASVVLFVCALVLPYLEGIAGVLATASLPLLSGLMLTATLRDIEQHGSETTTPVAPQPLDRNLLRTFARIAGILFLAYFVVGFSSGAQPSGGGSPQAPFQALGLDVPTLLGSGVGIGLVACFVLFAVRVNFDALFRWVAPLLTLGLALAPIGRLETGFLAGALICTSDTALQIGAMLFAVTLARRGAMSGAVGAGLAQGAIQLGVLVGNVAGSSSAPLAATLPGGHIALTLGLVTALSFAWPLFPTSRVSRKAPGATRCAWQPAAPSAESTASVDGALSNPSAHPSEEPLTVACRTLSERGALSGREAEILAYLARGRSQPYIRDELMLSKNTVATHVKHLYQKLDVHSKQDLLDLIERTINEA